MASCGSATAARWATQTTSRCEAHSRMPSSGSPAAKWSRRSAWSVRIATISSSLDGVDLNTYGSRGQQRLAVLALKLAEADWMRAEVGDLPVILLDDVLSELDPERRQYVLQ